MAEAAGLALAVAPLIVPTYQGYRNVVMLIKSMCCHEKSLTQTCCSFQVQQRLFQVELTHILRHVVGKETAEAMIEDLGHAQWSNEEFEKEFEASLKPGVGAALKLILETLKEIEMVLRNVHEHIMPKGKAILSDISSSTDELEKPRSSKRQKIRGLGTRFEWAASGKKQVTKSLNVLRKQTQDLRSLREERAKLENTDIAATQQKKKSPHRQDSWNTSPEIIAVREISERLYEGLKGTATCRCHRVNLRLGMLMEAKKGAAIRADFRLVITPEKDDAYATLSGPQCFCLSVTSEAQTEDFLVPDSQCSDLEPVLRFSLPTLSPQGTRSGIVEANRKKPGDKKAPESESSETSTSKATFQRSKNHTKPSTIKKKASVRVPHVTFAVDNIMEPRTANAVPDIPRSYLDKGKHKGITSDAIPAATITIKQLCSVLKSPDQCSNALYLGNLENTTYRRFRHCVYQEPITFPLSYRISLAELLTLTHTEKPRLLPRRERIRIALILSTAVLQNGSFSESWFQERWRSKDIYFFVDRQQRLQDTESTSMDPHVAALFGDQTTLTTDRTNISPRIAKNDHLFSLAIVLTEIAFGDILANIDDRKTIQGDPNDIVWEFLKMREILKSRILAHEIGRRYASVVTRCMDCDFGLGEDDLTTAKVQGAFYRKVVKELETCMERFDEE